MFHRQFHADLTTTVKLVNIAKLIGLLKSIWTRFCLSHFLNQSSKHATTLVKKFENQHVFFPFFALCSTNFYLYNGCGSYQRIKHLLDTWKENLAKSQILSFLFKNVPNKTGEDEL